MTNTNSTLSTIINEMESTDNHVSLMDLIFDYMMTLTNTQRDSLGYNPDDMMTTIQFNQECEMYIWGQYVLHGSVDQDQPIVGRMMYRTDDNLTMVSDYFLGETETTIQQFVNTRLSYI